MSQPVNQEKRSRENRATTVTLSVYNLEGLVIRRFKADIGEGCEVYIDTDKERLLGPIRFDKFGNCWQ